MSFDSSHHVTKVLEFQLQHQSLQWLFRTDFLYDGLVGSPCHSQHHTSKASILQRSAFFIVQFSHPYMTTGKTIALTRWTFVGKVMSLLFNMLPRFVIAFLPRNKRLLISWLQSLFSWAPKSLQMVIAAMKLKDACSLEEKLWPT